MIGKVDELCEFELFLLYEVLKIGSNLLQNEYIFMARKKFGHDSHDSQQCKVELCQ